jgi:hypothetical protein
MRYHQRRKLLASDRLTTAYCVRAVAECGIHFPEHAAIKARATAGYGAFVETAEITVELRVRERTTGVSMSIEQSRTIDLPTTVGDVTQVIRELVVSLATHEVDESLHLQGARVFDPHKPKRFRKR